MEQRSMEWYAERYGKITGSMVGCLMKPTEVKKDTFGDTAKGYLYQTAWDRMKPWEGLTDEQQIWVTQRNPVTKDMQRGIEQEAEAKAALEFAIGMRINETGGLHSSTITTFRDSPDGITEDGRAVEIKCPREQGWQRFVNEVVKQISYGARANEVMLAYNPDYYWQCVAHMHVLDAKSCLFSVYTRGAAKTPYIEIERDEEDEALMLGRIRKAEEFIEESIAAVELLNV